MDPPMLATVDCRLAVWRRLKMPIDIAANRRYDVAFLVMNLIQEASR
jgi:hypothetical protein